MRHPWTSKSRAGKIVVMAAVFLVAFGGTAFARGQAEPPELQAGSAVPEQDPYFSREADADGVYMIAIAPNQAVDEVVDSFLVAVINENDEIVWEQSGVNEDRRGGFGRLLQNIGLLSPRSSISFEQVPRSADWDGSYGISEGFSIPAEYEEEAPDVFAGLAEGTNGEPVPDGVYQYVVSILYSNGALSITTPDEESTIYVDNTEPSGDIAIVSPATGAAGVFAPGSEIAGAKGSIDFTISTTAAEGYATDEEWALEIANGGGTVVHSAGWGYDEEPDTDYTWDGTDTGGDIVAGGTYTVTLRAEDRAGNQARFQTNPIIVDTAERAFELSAVASNAIIPGKAAISPNGDGIQDTVVVSFSDSQEMLEALATRLYADEPGGPVVLTLTDADGTEVTSWTDLPASWTDEAANFTFDGTNADSAQIAEGVYTARVEATYQNGMVISDSIQLVIDTTPPLATDVSITPDLFSPNGDGHKDSATVDHDLAAVNPTEYTDDGTYVATDNVPADYWFGGILVDQDVQAIVAFIPGVDPSTPVTAFNPRLVASLANSYFPQANLSPNQIVYGGPQPPTSPVIWHGRDLSGNVVPDATYTYYLVAVDTAGNVIGVNSRGLLVGAAGGPAAVTVDNRETEFQLAASAEIGPRRLYAASGSQSGLYVSPNGDGVSETITFTPTLALEEGINTYTYEVIGSDGTAVFTQRGNGTPGELVWDGSANAVGVPAGDAPDGLYTAQLSLVYAKGDEPSASTSMFMLDRAEPTADVAAGLDSFSPNGDGVDDSVVITPSVSVDADQLASYSFRILSPSGNVTRGVVQDAPSPFTWNGRNTAGAVPANGTYRAVVEIEHLNGATARAEYPVTLNALTLNVAVSSNVQLLSPNGDGRNDSATITPRVTPADALASYTLQIQNAAGRVVRAFPGTQPQAVTWNGTGNDGALLPNGEYTIVVTAQATNEASGSAQTTLTLDSTVPEVSVQADRSAFSPNDDGVAETVTFTPSVDPSDRLQSYQLQILDAANNVVRSVTGARPAPYTWDGTNERGETVGTGRYTARVTVTRTNQATAEGRSDPVRLDAELGPVALSFSEELISPNDDGFLDTVDLMIDAAEVGEYESWTLEITNEEGSARTLSGGSEAPTTVFEWDGRNDEGDVIDGVYHANLVVRYSSGSSTTSSTTEPVRIDTTPPDAALRLNPEVFSPDGDGLNETVLMTLALDDVSEIAAWTLEVFDPNGDTFKRFPEGSGMVRSVQWDGVSDDGELVTMARDYTVAFTATDAAGNTATGDRTLTTDIFVEERFGQWKIQVPDIIFQGWTAVYRSWDQEYGPRNLVTLERVAEMLQKFPDYEIELHGHAVSLLYEDPEEATDEQEQTLLPLSEDRAQAIEQALVERGISGDRIEIKFFGGARPIVPFSNLEERRINRRVEFYLIRE